MGRKNHYLFLLVSTLTLLFAAAAAADPQIPARDDEVIEHLTSQPLGKDRSELRLLRASLRDAPKDPAVAAALAKRYMAVASSTGDPRYAGFAEAALAPWWTAAEPGAEILLLRAQIKQYVHRFNPALADIEQALTLEPQNAQAWLSKAAILVVQGDFSAANAACLKVENSGSALVASACRANVMNMRGQNREALTLLSSLVSQPTLRRGHRQDSGLSAWIYGIMAEAADHLGDKTGAENFFHRGLEQIPDDPFLLCATADFYLAEGRARAAYDLLNTRTNILVHDGMLLRLALAEKALGINAAAAHTALLQERFAEGVKRGTRVHQREEAILALKLLNAPATALSLAREDWLIQRETPDVRTLAAAAFAAHDTKTLTELQEWSKLTGYQDARLASATKGDVP